MSNIKQAFINARQTRNMLQCIHDIINEPVYAIGKSDLINGGGFDFALAKSPLPQEYCVTVSSDSSLLSFKNWDIKLYKISDLINRLPPNAGIMFIYADGGDYASAVQLASYRSDKK